MPYPAGHRAAVKKSIIDSAKCSGVAGNGRSSSRAIPVARRYCSNRESTD
jgi:hypothetical protein